MASEKKFSRIKEFFKLKKSNNNKENNREIQNSKKKVLGLRTTQSDDEYELDDRVEESSAGTLKDAPFPYDVITEPKRSKAPKSCPGGVDATRSQAKKLASRHGRRVEDESEAFNNSFHSEHYPSTSAAQNADAAFENRRRKTYRSSRYDVRDHVESFPGFFQARPPRSRRVKQAPPQYYPDDSSPSSSANNDHLYDQHLQQSHRGEYNQYALGKRPSKSVTLRDSRGACASISLNAKEEIMWLRQENYMLNKKLESVFKQLEKEIYKRRKLREQMKLEQGRTMAESQQKQKLIAELEKQLNLYKMGAPTYFARSQQQNQNFLTSANSFLTPSAAARQPSAKGSGSKAGYGSGARLYQQRCQNNFPILNGSLTGQNDSNSIATSSSLTAADSDNRRQHGQHHDHHRRQKHYNHNTEEIRGSGESLAEHSDSSIISGGTNTGGDITTTKTTSNSTDVGAAKNFRCNNNNIEVDGFGSHFFEVPAYCNNYGESSTLEPALMNGDGVDGLAEMANTRRRRPLHKMTGSLPNGHLNDAAVLRENQKQRQQLHKQQLKYQQQLSNNQQMFSSLVYASATVPTYPIFETPLIDMGFNQLSDGPSSLPIRNTKLAKNESSSLLAPIQFATHPQQQKIKPAFINQHTLPNSNNQHTVNNDSNRDYDNLFQNVSQAINEANSNEGGTPFVNLPPPNQIDENDMNDEVKNFRTEHVDSSIQDTDDPDELERDKRLLANDSANTSSRTNSDVFSSSEAEIARCSDCTANESLREASPNRSPTITTETLTEDSSSSYSSITNMPFSDSTNAEEGSTASLTYENIGHRKLLEKSLRPCSSTPAVLDKCSARNMDTVQVSEKLVNMQCGSELYENEEEKENRPCVL